jgi:enoyl-[acyl-carrier-protein] reductase (NADH)
MLPTGRPVLASEIAQTCAFLLGDLAVSMTGQELTVDGGATVGRGYALYR